MEQKICNDELYEEVAKELNISIAMVKEIVNIQSIFTVNTIKKGEFSAIRYVYLGKIFANEGKIKNIEKANEKKQLKENN